MSAEAGARELLLLVDGSNLLFQMFYGMPSRIIDGRGRPIHGTLGFVGALLKLIKMTLPTHIAVIFDGEHKNARTELDPEYKANREDYSQMAEEETPFSQLPDIYAALDLIGVKHTETRDCETDDVIASYALRLVGDTDIVISSGDSDFFQLVTDRVSLIRYRGEHTVLCTPEWIKRRFGVPPELYADYKALVGDSSDNIRGAKGVGPKTAAKLLSLRPSLADVLESIDDGHIRPTLKAELMASRERLYRNYKLIKLDAGAELPFELCELTAPGEYPSTREVMARIANLK